jgi:hypothetical protein
MTEQEDPIFTARANRRTCKISTARLQPQDPRYVSAAGGGGTIYSVECSAASKLHGSAQPPNGISLPLEGWCQRLAHGRRSYPPLAYRLSAALCLPLSHTENRTHIICNKSYVHTTHLQSAESQRLSALLLLGVALAEARLRLWKVPRDPCHLS